MKTEIDQALSDQVDHIIRSIAEQEFKIGMDEAESDGAYAPHLEEYEVKIEFNAITEQFKMASTVGHNHAFVQTTASTVLELLRDHFSQTHPNESCIIDDYDPQLLDQSVIAGCIIQKSCRAYEIDSDAMYIGIYVQSDGAFEVCVDYYDSDIRGIPFEDDLWEDMIGSGEFKSVSSSVIMAIEGIAKARTEEMKALP